LKKRTLYEELEIIDEALAELEERRTNLVNRIESSISKCGSSNVLSFPNRVTVRRLLRGSTDWPQGSKAKSPVIE
jgi:hypothetical protein